MPFRLSAKEREREEIIRIFSTTISSLDFLLKHFTPRKLLKKYGYSDSVQIKIIKWLREKAHMHQMVIGLISKLLFLLVAKSSLVEHGFKTLNNPKFCGLAVTNYKVEVNANERAREGGYSYRFPFPFKRA